MSDGRQALLNNGFFNGSFEAGTNNALAYSLLVYCLTHRLDPVLDSSVPCDWLRESSPEIRIMRVSRDWYPFDGALPG